MFHRLVFQISDDRTKHFFSFLFFCFVQSIDLFNWKCEVKRVKWEIFIVRKVSLKLLKSLSYQWEFTFVNCVFLVDISVVECSLFIKCDNSLSKEVGIYSIDVINWRWNVLINSCKSECRFKWNEVTFLLRRNCSMKCSNKQMKMSCHSHSHSHSGASMLSFKSVFHWFRWISSKRFCSFLNLSKRVRINGKIFISIWNRQKWKIPFGWNQCHWDGAEILLFNDQFNDFLCKSISVSLSLEIFFSFFIEKQVEGSNRFVFLSSRHRINEKISISIECHSQIPPNWLVFESFFEIISHFWSIWLFTISISKHLTSNRFSRNELIIEINWD